MPGVASSGLADVLAVCDLDKKRATAGAALVEKTYREKNATAPAVAGMRDYRELLARKDIDAVVISTPDHWHAEIALAAVLAGKDVYLQKPFTMTHAEGVLLRDAAAKSGRIFQVGSQQRSWEQFRRACEVVRSGRIGQVRRVEIGLPIDPTQPDRPEQKVPANLDYDAWLGPTPRAYYTEHRVHPQGSYNRPGLAAQRGVLSRHDHRAGARITSTRMHWALDVELTGPITRGRPRGVSAQPVWNVHGAYDVELTYPGRHSGERVGQASERPQVHRRRRLGVGDARRARPRAAIR